MVDHEMLKLLRQQRVRNVGPSSAGQVVVAAPDAAAPGAEQALGVPAPFIPPALAVPQITGDPTIDMALSQGVNPCDLGLCPDETTSVSVGGRPIAFQGPRATATAAINSAGTWEARQADQIFRAQAGLPVASTIAGANQDYGTAAIQNMQSTPEFAAYVAQLTPLFGDAAPAVAAQQMAQANGLTGDYLASAQRPSDIAQRHMVAGQAQAAGLTAGDTSAALAMFGIDPGAFNSGVTYIDNPSGLMGNIVGGQVVTPSAPLAAMPGFNPAHTAVARYAGMPAYVAATQAVTKQGTTLARDQAKITAQTASRVTAIEAKGAQDMKRAQLRATATAANRAATQAAIDKRHADTLAARAKAAANKGGGSAAASPI